ncbi:MAG: hypothetical protein GW942_00160 [Candidatus Pacebacteria bacterium]|nr:hypothetical protein [Candidatus Paceibacterota bacterium]
MKKTLLITLGISVAAAGTIFYLDKTKPGLILGTSTSAKDYIEEKIPQSKIFLDKVIPSAEKTFSENELSDSSLEEADNNNQDLTEQNKFLKESLEMSQKQLETLRLKSEEVKNHLINLSEEVKEASDGSQLHEKAFEYGQYVYCQQVVEQYKK